VTASAFQEAGQTLFRLVSLQRSPGELSRLIKFLSQDELQRGKRLLDPKKREDFHTGRGLLREVLAEVTREEPGEIRIAEGDHGKPYLPYHQGAKAICFNVSHSGSFLLVAVSVERHVGVDLELVREDLEFHPMAKRYFSTREQEELFSLPPAEQLSAFYRCWTRKEAYLKGTGSGFSQPSTCFDVSLLPGQPVALLGHRVSPDEVGRWSIDDLPVPQGYCAAVAVEK